MGHLNTNLYLNPSYPEILFTFTSGLYKSIIPSGQGHFAEQPLPSGATTKLDSTIHQTDPYNVGQKNAVGLISATQVFTDYTCFPSGGTVNFYNDSGILQDTITNVPISFLRPAYSVLLKTSIFPINRISGIINAEAHPLALDAATSGGGFNYLSNAYYYITKKSTVDFAEHQIINRGDYTPGSGLNQRFLSNNIQSISQVSGTLSNTLDY